MIELATQVPTRAAVRAPEEESLAASSASNHTAATPV